MPEPHQSAFGGGARFHQLLARLQGDHLPQGEPIYGFLDLLPTTKVVGFPRWRQLTLPPLEEVLAATLGGLRRATSVVSPMPCPRPWGMRGAKAPGGTANCWWLGSRHQLESTIQLGYDIVKRALTHD